MADYLTLALTLTLTLEQRGPAGAFVLPDEQVAVVGEGRRTFPVRVSVNGVTLPLRVARMGGEYLIGLSRAAREQAGVSIGSAYVVGIAPDVGTRAVEVPEDLAGALAGDAEAQVAFEALAPSHRKEFVRWITEAKREATRAQRVTKTIEMLRAGTHR
ncbi:YdeI/OmpD-associated family protein [Micromonospora chersina]|uniref:YdeI/OmpD-associated family protein n=1 Tax=Micromonospora chersina TaxID=47854 RepID=UPI003692DCF2